MTVLLGKFVFNIGSFYSEISKMVGNKSKTFLIGTYTEKNISLIKIHNIIHVLHTSIILLSSFVIYFSENDIRGVFLLYCRTIVKSHPMSSWELMTYNEQCT